MFLNARNRNIKIQQTDMDYISFGRGSQNLILIPGLSDGLRTVKGTAPAMAFMYRKYAKQYKVYVFSRKNQLDHNESIKDMARSQVEVMKKLGITKASILGVSQGGMIAQHIAIEYPEMVENLVLAVTLARQNPTITTVINRWQEMAASNDFKSLFINTFENTYSEKYLKKYRPFYPLLARFSKPKDPKRFIIQANAILRHDVYRELEKIKCPTLIIGGDRDKIVGSSSAEVINEKIANSKIIVYNGLGHGAYEEAKDFNQKVLEFLNENNRERS